jgi:hypothetical protein
MDLEINEVSPVFHPLIKQLSVIGLHYLKTPRQLVIHPTRHIVQARWSHATAFPKPTINGYGIAAFEVLDYHVESHHVSLIAAGNAQ